MDFKFESYNSDRVLNPKTGKNEVIGFQNIPLSDKWVNLTTEAKAEIIKSADRICRWKVPESEKSVLVDRMDSFASAVGFKGNATANPHKTEENHFNVFCNRRPSDLVSFSDMESDLQDDELLKMLGIAKRYALL